MIRNNIPSRTVARAAGLVGVCILLGTAGLLFAGPLDPPTGPITPTYKTLTEVEPRTAINATNTPGDADSLFRITQPGSYYFTGNITGVAEKHGIEIAADGVSLDLGGFALLGVARTLDAITTAGVPRVRIEVRNGSIGAFAAGGVDLQGAGAVVSDLRVRVCTGAGIHVGEAAIVTRCTSSGNQGSGIECGVSGVIEACTLRSNTLIGIDAGIGTTVLGCAASANGGSGIRTNSGCSITNCTSYLNGGQGISADFNSTVTNCSVNSNASTGISSTRGCLIAGCSSADNDGIGIRADAGGTVIDCTSTSNTNDGIQCVSSCVIRGNTCSFNGGSGGDGAGIHATFEYNRIEGNNCRNADRGIQVDSTNSIIINNTCSANTTNWVIAANNVYGPIINRSSIATAAVNGSSAPDTTATTHPHANFTY
jgi:parallel beta-helix repeat protein